MGGGWELGVGAAEEALNLAEVWGGIGCGGRRLGS